MATKCSLFSLVPAFLVCVAAISCSNDTPASGDGGGTLGGTNGQLGGSSGSGGVRGSTTANKTGGATGAGGGLIGGTSGGTTNSGGTSGAGGGGSPGPHDGGSDANTPSDTKLGERDVAAEGGGESGASSARWCLPLGEHPQGVDWGKALIDARIKGGGGLGWSYPEGLFLHGVYLAYKRLNDPKYLAYIKAWADGHTGGAGGYGSLDSMQPALVLDDMYRETKDAKYGTAPAAVAARLEGGYPKTSDGGFWHSTGLQGQLWGDGVFMNLPPYVNHADLFGNTKAYDIATTNLIVYDKHLAAPNDLHVHQWSEVSGKQSCCEWCRAEGWYEMALLMVLDLTPTTHPNYPALVAIVERLAKGLKATQDPATGRWWQVMDRPNDAGNWLETSCTAMHTYFLSRASQKGYIDGATYGPLAIKGFQGEMQQVSNPADVQIKDICPGTNVGDNPGFYYARPKATNDNHGLGAFLVMYDQLVCR